MNSKKVIVLALALAGAAAAGLAQARGNPDVQWSITIGTPLGAPGFVQPPPQYLQPYPVYSAPVVVVPRYPYQKHLRFRTGYLHAHVDWAQSCPPFPGPGLSGGSPRQPHC